MRYEYRKRKIKLGSWIVGIFLVIVLIWLINNKFLPNQAEIESKLSEELVEVNIDNKADETSLIKKEKSELTRNQKKISKECIKRVKEVTGNNFTINYMLRIEPNLKEFWHFKSKFPHQQESFESGRDHPINQNQYSRTTKVRVISDSLRLGEKEGENPLWLYGGFEYQYDYILEQVTNSTGEILGDNHFTIKVKVDDLSDYYPSRIGEGSSIYEAKFYHMLIDLEVDDIVEVVSCHFVN